MCVLRHAKVVHIHIIVLATFIQPESRKSPSYGQYTVHTVNNTVKLKTQYTPLKTYIINKFLQKQI